MMLRPATPLTLFFLIAFVLLLLSTISTPVVHSIPLAAWEGYNFGVFGYCQVSGTDQCTPAQVGYPINGIFSTTDADDFTLPSDTRHTLSSILIVHPVAAFMTLVCTILAAASHFRGPSHSPRFLLALLILTFPTLLITLLAFLVDILLFIPHMAWGGWIVLAATIIITACSVLTCAMRRTLVSRKARKKRIAENADMSGENFYAMKQPQTAVARAESPPPMDGTLNEPKPGFALFEHTSRSSNDDRVPLNVKEPSISTDSTTNLAAGPSSDANAQGNTNLSGSTIGATAGAVAGTAAFGATHQDEPPRGPRGAERDSERRRERRAERGERDRYGPVIPGPYRGGGLPRGSQRGGPMFFGPPRGGFPPQRGGMPPRAAYRGGPMGQPYPGRGSFGPGPRGNFQGMPPPGWNRGRGMPGRGPPGYGPGPYGRSPPTSPREYDARGPSAFSPGSDGQQPFGESHPAETPTTWSGPATQALYSPRNQPDQEEVTAAAVIDAYGAASPDMNVHNSSARERDPASFGFSGRQSPARGIPPRSTSPVPPVPGQVEVSELDSAPLMEAPAGVVVSELESPPSGTQGTPLLSNWQTEPVEIGSSSPRHGRFQEITSPVELPTEHSIAPLQQTVSHARSASSNYYEDVDPKFATDEPVIPPNPTINAPPTSLLQRVLIPGSSAAQQRYGETGPSSAYEDGLDPDRNEGNRSPAASETSNFTSISQRPINPSWRPSPPSGPMMVYPPASRGGWGGHPGSSVYSGPAGKASSKYSHQETLLNANPDFSIPGISPMPRRKPPSGLSMPPRPSHGRVTSGGSHQYPM